MKSSDPWFSLGDGMWPRRVLDAAAARRLADVLAPAVDRLRSFGVWPALIAESPDKYNDAFWDDYWYAVQIGPALWEQSQFFKGDRSEPFVKDFRRVPALPSGNAAEAAKQENAERDLIAGRKLLNDLHRSRWRELAAEALEGYGFVLCLAIEFGQAWLCRSWPDCGEGDVWVWTEQDGFVHFGICQRLDCDIGLDAPLYFQSVNPDAVPMLTPQARQFFIPEPIDRQAFDVFAGLIRKAVQDVGAITREWVGLGSGGSRRFGLDGAGLWFGLSPRLRWDEHSIQLALPDAPWQPTDADAGDTHPEEVHRLRTVLARLEAADWRGLFGKAFGTPLREPQMLALFVEGGQAVLVRENTVFEIGPCGPAFAGLCDYPDIEAETPPHRLSLAGRAAETPGAADRTDCSPYQPRRSGRAD